MNKHQRKALKQSYFERGAAAIRRYNGRELYCCPMCGKGFDRNALVTGDLTLEDSPPKSIGGRPIALTCRICNSGSGHSFESNLAKREEITALSQIILGERLNKGVRVSLEIGNTRINARLYQDEKGIRTFKTLEGNDPKAIDQVISLFNETKIWDGQQLHVRSHASYSHRLALIAELKAAFVAAFAALGYRYVFDHRLRCVREQILKPSETIIDGWNCNIEHVLIPEFTLLLVQSFPAVIVKFGQSSVILPWVTGPDNLYEDLASQYQRGENIQITGKLLSWPSKLEMALDFATDKFS